MTIVKRLEQINKQLDYLGKTITKITLNEAELESTRYWLRKIEAAREVLKEQDYLFRCRALTQ